MGVRARVPVRLDHRLMRWSHRRATHRAGEAGEHPWNRHAGGAARSLSAPVPDRTPLLCQGFLAEPYFRLRTVAIKQRSSKSSLMNCGPCGGGAHKTGAVQPQLALTDCLSGPSGIAPCRALMRKVRPHLQKHCMHAYEPARITPSCLNNSLWPVVQVHSGCPHSCPL